MGIRNKLVQIAQAEIGTCEPTGDDKYIQVWNTLGHTKFALNVAWCAIFVTWCKIHAGISSNVVPDYASCNAGMKWFKDKAKFQFSKAYGGNYVPLTGDIVFFTGNYSKTNSSHTGIVEKVEGNVLYTIEGNTSDAVHERKYDLSNKYILGYGTPAYNDNDVISSQKPTVQTDVTPSGNLYTVQKGDSLWGIAQKTLGDGNRYREIMSLNSLTSTTIHAGLILQIPSGTSSQTSTQTYTVKNGDSLWKIAQSLLGNGARYKEIMVLSGLTSTTIHVGQTLTVPAR